MVTDLFGSLMEEFSAFLKIKLAPTAQHCAIKTKSGLIINLEIASSGEVLLMVCKLPDIPSSGRYRENLLYEALRADGLPPPNHGILAYSNRTKQLVIFKEMKLQDLTGEKIYNAFTPFVAKAQVWSDAISRGEVPQFSAAAGVKSSGGLFGLR